MVLENSCTSFGASSWPILPDTRKPTADVERGAERHREDIYTTIHTKLPQLCFLVLLAFLGYFS